MFNIWEIGTRHMFNICIKKKSEEANAGASKLVDIIAVTDARKVPAAY